MASRMASVSVSLFSYFIEWLFRAPSNMVGYVLTPRIGTRRSQIRALARKNVWSPPTSGSVRKQSALTHGHHQVDALDVFLLDFLLRFDDEFLAHAGSTGREVTDDSMVLIVRLLPANQSVCCSLTAVPCILARCRACLVDQFSQICPFSMFYRLQASSCTCSPLAWFYV